MNAVAGTSRVLRLALRRERTIAPWWILAVAGFAAMFVFYVDRVMGAPDVMPVYVAMFNRNAFFQALGGGFAIPDLGYLATWRSSGFLYLLNGLAALLTVVRYTRADEDAGRIELLRASAVSRHAPLTAALLVAAGIGLAGGALTTITLIAIGMDPSGSSAYGAAITAAGWVFGAIAAVACQIAGTARTARIIGLSALGIAYVLRYAGDATGQYWMKYLSPVGWSHAVQPYWSDRWWVLAIPVAVTAVLVAVAYGLNSRRDLGAGLIPEGRGAANAPGLRGPVSLSWRLNRGLLVKWSAGIAIFAASAGAASTIAYQWTEAPATTTDLLIKGFGGTAGASELDFFLRAIILIFAYAIALYPVLMVQRLRSEETSGRAEIVLATRITQRRWAFGQLVVAALGTIVLLSIAGLVFGVFYAWLVGDPATDISRIFLGTLGIVPAAWLIGAVCLFAYGLVPKASVAISWAVWAAVAVHGRVIGPLYGQWGGGPFEPFHYIPNTVAGQPFDPWTVLVMLTLSALLVAGGMLGLRRRDFG